MKGVRECALRVREVEVVVDLVEGRLARRAVLELEGADAGLDLVGRRDGGGIVLAAWAVANRGAASKAQAARTAKGFMSCFIDSSPLLTVRLVLECCMGGSAIPDQPLERARALVSSQVRVVVAPADTRHR